MAPSDEHIRSSRWLSLGVRDLNCTRVGLGLRTRLVAPLSGVGIRPCVLERHSLHAQWATRPGPGHGRKGRGDRATSRDGPQPKLSEAWASCAMLLPISQMEKPRRELWIG